MITAAKSSNASHCAVQINLICTTQLSQINLSIERMQCISNLTTIRDFLPDQSIQLGKIDFTLCKLNSFHAAPDIDSYHPRYNLVPDSHRGTDGAALTSMDIRHDTDLTTGKLRLIAYCLDLLRSQILQRGSVTNSGII